jgi:nucleotide-binding universal stress UspA family protein
MQPADSNAWAVGVELLEDHLGPVRFAATLGQSSKDEPIIGIHVIPDQEWRHPLISHEEADEIRKRVLAGVVEVMGKQGLAGERVRVELAEDDEIDRGLSEVAGRLGVKALIVGRRARRDDDPIVRLGQVARRILRRLPAPVIVVPPDYGQGDDPGLGAGPVILGCDLSEHSVAAASFARDLAQRFGRELLVAHGTQSPDWGISYIPTATITRMHEQAEESGRTKLDEWMAAHQLSGVRRHVFIGDPARHLLELAHAEQAAVLVTGSRRLGPVERLFLASVGSEIAAGASCPVAVVPGS